MRKTPFFILCIILTLAFCGVFFIAKPSGGEQGVKTEKQYIELWHVDMFEGGTGSRASFLNGISKEFEKLSGICVTVKTQTPLSVSDLFQKGIFPDAISFANGMELPYAMLRKVHKKPYEYAVPWCMGGYAAISRKGETVNRVVIAEQKNTLASLAVRFYSGDNEFLKGIGLKNCEKVPSNNAVYELYSDKHAMLIGTQRDLYRLENKGLNLEITPLGGFNDLYQYYSILSADDENAVAAAKFCEYLLSEKVQSRLSRIGMLSAFFENSDMPIAALSGVKHDYCTYPLTDNDRLSKLRRLAENGADDDEIKGLLMRLASDDRVRTQSPADSQW